MAADTYACWPKRILVGRVWFDAATPNEALRLIDYLVSQDSTHSVVFCDSHLCARASKSPEILGHLEQASLVFPDGAGITLAGRILRQRFQGRVTGPSTMLAYMRHGAPNGVRHFLYGGGEGVAESLRNTLEIEIPGIQIVGVSSPPFRELNENEQKETIEHIGRSEADVVWVGLGAPKQEAWMHRHHDKLKGKVMMGVGAAFDFHSGERKWAPLWIRRIGMEWLFRMATGGKRVLWRNLKNLSIYSYLVGVQRLSQLASTTRPSPPSRASAVMPSESTHP